MIFSVAGVISMGMHWAKIGSPVPLSVDFRGGTEVKIEEKKYTLVREDDILGVLD